MIARKRSQLGWFGTGFRFVFGLEILTIVIYLVLSTWGVGVLNLSSILILIGMVVFFYGGLSFFLQAVLRLPGCEAAVLPYLLKGKPLYDCVLMAQELDKIEQERGFSFSVLTSTPWLLHFASLMFLTLFTFGLLIAVIPIELPGVISVLIVVLLFVPRQQIKSKMIRTDT